MELLVNEAISQISSLQCIKHKIIHTSWDKYNQAEILHKTGT